MMKTRYILPAILLLAALSAAAQDLNPTVRVTNAYDGKLLQVRKPAQHMDIPDSLTKFDLTFDYSVFENPYKGAYEFKPYLVDMAPRPDAYDGRKFYLRAGAGVSLHPEFDLLWSPSFKVPFWLNVYASHNSYFGKYRRSFVSRRGADPGSELFVVTNHEKAAETIAEEDYRGYEMRNTLGAEGLYEWEDGAFNFDVGYIGLATKLYETSNYNALQLKTGVRSKDLGGSYMYYDANASWRFAMDDVSFSGGPYESLKINDIKFWGTFGPVINSENRFLVDASLDLSLYGGAFKTSMGLFSFTPKYLLSLDRLSLSLGARLSMPVRDSDLVYGYPLNAFDGQFIYPDVYADFQIVPERLDVYARVTGGATLNDYTAQKEDNWFFHPRMARNYGPLSDLTAERINAAIGFRGNYSNRFRFDIYGGYRAVANGLLQTVFYNSVKPGGLPKDIYPGIVYGDYGMAYAGLKFVYDGSPVLFQGKMLYGWTNIAKKGLNAFEPAPFTMDLKLRYNWRDRIYAGIRGSMATARRGRAIPQTPATQLQDVKLPGWFDLGLNAEAVFSRSLSFWVDASNLLNMTIYRSPLYPASGIWFTAGLTLSLQ